ncbi:protein-glutamine gamma-glutamyltransferase [Calidifontibacillus oryziterrae]|uniref:protein-glutamine gamma-glutamyltransferase n=1 Tax=Calidifontibacillus oryziterrae TaxID=1191699 RepID=UPI0003118E53|nr:protein-glutamine gamma-glutamyltransferase [Calidifontibacillus oryziterrae]
MIQISGVPFQNKIEKLELGNIEKTIIHHMQEAPVHFSYYSINELLFELKVRKNIIESALEMNQGEARFTSFEYARCNPKYWYLTTAGGFLLKPNVKPSDAILDIYKNSSRYAFECATASVIIFYYAVLYSIGIRLFNSLFQNLYLYSWHTDPDLAIYTFYSNHFLPGDVVYFNNPDFNPKTPWFRGVNAVLLNDGKYFGHGFSIRTSEQMIQILNEKRKPWGNQSSYLTSLVTRPSFNHLVRLANLERTYRVFKNQLPVVHHNKCSISYVQYINFLLQPFIKP